jgi:3-deoxy-7-phosphoheptulonate synthase
MALENVGALEADGWSPDSWRSKPIHAQAVHYEDEDVLIDTCRTLRTLPPLVSITQINVARAQFAKAARGEAFILQGGDCAESFEDVQMDIIGSKVSLLTEQASILQSSLGLRVATVGRIAGQYAKPRSSPFETLEDGTKIHAFRGHNVNGVALAERTPDPMRLLLGYFHSATTLNAVSILQKPNSLTMSSASTAQGNSATNSKSGTGFTPLFTSHEALHLPYETSMTRGRYNTSASFLWLGERTRQLVGAHVEYMRGLENPIGVKLGPTISPAELVTLLDKLCSNKDASIGRVTLITRLGVANVENVLPALIKAVQDSGHRPVWMTDPCHGNTITYNGIKTRSTATMLEEIKLSYTIHSELDSRLGGLHLEQTGESVEECVEGVMVGPGALRFGVNYRTLCDPRLSREQAIWLVAEFAKHVQRSKGPCFHQAQAEDFTHNAVTDSSRLIVIQC